MQLLVTNLFLLGTTLAAPILEVKTPFNAPQHDHIITRSPHPNPIPPHPVPLAPRAVSGHTASPPTRPSIANEAPHPLEPAKAKEVPLVKVTIGGADKWLPFKHVPIDGEMLTMMHLPKDKTLFVGGPEKEREAMLQTASKWQAENNMDLVTWETMWKGNQDWRIYYNNLQEYRDIFQMRSDTLMAIEASGTVRVTLPSDIIGKNWPTRWRWNVQYILLKANPDVNQIVRVHPETNKEEILWTRPPADGGKK